MVFRAASIRGALALVLASSVAASSGCGRSTANASRAAAGQNSADEGGTGANGVGEGGVAEGGAAPQAGTTGGGTETGGTAAEAGSAGQSPLGDAGQAGAPTSVPPKPTPTLRLSAITISQTHELPLMQAGSVVTPDKRPAALVAGKHALVRAFVDVDPDFAARPLIGVLDVKSPQVTRTLVSQLTVAQSSQQDDLTTTFVFNVDANDLNTTSTYRVRVLEADTTPLTLFPPTGYLDLGAQTMPPFELVVVPFLSNGFGPKLTDVELTALKHRLLALYPSTGVDISLAPPQTLPYVVNGAGDGWDNALDLIYKVRMDAAPAHNVFYYGMMAPDDSYTSYCASGCTLGYSNVADPDDVDSRGSIGIGVFQDGTGTKDAYDTVAHELGHALGREHAPCGVDDPDPDYPYPNAGMGGIYGYDFDQMRLVKPKAYRDVMSYCTPVWISDYTYRAIFERLDYIANESFRLLAFEPPTLFRLARIRRDGQTLWLGDRHRNGTAKSQAVALLDSVGRAIGNVQAQVVHIDHAPGAYVWLPAQALTLSAAASVDLRPLGGSVLPL